MAGTQRDEALNSVANSYDDWLLELPHVYDRGDGRAKCDAIKLLDHVAGDLRVLMHLLIRNDEAALASRLERSFKAVRRSAQAIRTFVNSSEFDDTEWLDGDTLGQTELILVQDDSIDLQARANEIVSECREDSWTILTALGHAAFWLAFNLRHRGAESIEARKGILEFLSPRRLRRQHVLRLTTTAMWRAHGRLALGYEYLERCIGRGKLKATHTFVEELQLARVAPSRLAQLRGFVQIEDIRDCHPDLTNKQIEQVRKRLEAWRKLHEDDVLTGSENPDTGRRRYAYPAKIAEEQIKDVRSRRRDK